MRVAILALATCALTGCATVDVITRTPTEITLQYYRGFGAEQSAEDLASQHCAVGGLVPRLTFDGGNYTQSRQRYECVPGPK